MTRGTRARHVAGAVLGALTVVLAVYGVAAVWGLTVEYGAGVQLLLVSGFRSIRHQADIIRRKLAAGQ